MPGFPGGLELGNVFSSLGSGDVASTLGTNVPANSGAVGTYGSWVQLIASTPFDTNFMIACLSRQASSSTDVLLQLGVGPAGGGEKPIVTIEEADWSSSPYFNATYKFPINIPAGTSISGRTTSCAAGGESCYVGLTLFDAGFAGMEGCAGMDMIASAASGSGIAYGTFVAGNSGNINQKSAWQLLGGSGRITPRDYVGFFVCLDREGDNSSFGVVTSHVMVDIGIGAVGSEKIIASDLAWSFNSNGPQSHDVLGPYFIPIPAGSSLSARIQDAYTGANFGLSLFMLYQ